MEGRIRARSADEGPRWVGPLRRYGVTGLAVAGVSLALAAPAAAHGPAGASKSLSERQLRTLETRLLGAEHAAEHAAYRRAQRRAARRPASRRATGHLSAAAAAGPPEAVGAWEGPARAITRNGRANESVPAIHAIMLATGKVLLFGPPLGPSTPRLPRVNESVAVLFDPVTRTFEDVPPPLDPRTGKRANIFCASASLMSDGRVLVMGGYLDYVDGGERNTKGLNQTWTFDPWTKQWQRHENLGGGNDPRDVSGGRWYPTQMLMPDGRTVVMLGIDETSVPPTGPSRSMTRRSRRATRSTR